MQQEQKLRRNFTLSLDVCELLDKQTNKSGAVEEALRLYFHHKDLVRKLAANTERIVDALEQRTQIKQIEKTYGKCCDGNRPDPETEVQPCPHWRQTEYGFKNWVTQEEFQI